MRFPRGFENVRKARVPKFPFVVAYVTDGEMIKSLVYMTKEAQISNRVLRVRWNEANVIMPLAVLIRMSGAQICIDNIRAEIARKRSRAIRFVILGLHRKSFSVSRLNYWFDRRIRAAECARLLPKQVYGAKKITH